MISPFQLQAIFVIIAGVWWGQRRENDSILRTHSLRQFHTMGPSTTWSQMNWKYIKFQSSFQLKLCRKIYEYCEFPAELWAIHLHVIFRGIIARRLSAHKAYSIQCWFSKAQRHDSDSSSLSYFLVSHSVQKEPVCQSAFFETSSFRYRTKIRICKFYNNTIR